MQFKCNILDYLQHYYPKRKKFSRSFTFANFSVKAVFVEDIFQQTCLLALKFIYFNLIFKATDISLYCYLLPSNLFFSVRYHLKGILFSFHFPYLFQHFEFNSKFADKYAAFLYSSNVFLYYFSLSSYSAMVLYVQYE